MISTNKLASVALAGVMAAPAGAAGGQAADSVSAITDALRSYERALNGSQTDAVMAHFAADGVFMPQHFASAVGADQVRAAYQRVFATIRLAVAFEIVEIVPVAEDWAFARTNTVGTVTVLASGLSGPEANQELFVFQRIDGAWKIARYAFSTVNPPRS